MYLGVTLDRRLNMNLNTYNFTQKAKRARAALYPILNRYAAIPTSFKLAILKIYIRLILLYASTAVIKKHLIQCKKERNTEKYRK